MATKILTLLAMLLMVATVPVVLGAEEKEGKENEEKVALDKVPAEILKAAAEAVKGFKATEAEKEVEGDKVTWEVEGTASDGKTYEVKLDATGKVLKVKEEKADKDGDKEGDDDKDDDKDDMK